MRLKKTKEQDDYTVFRVGGGLVVTLPKEVAEAMCIISQDKLKISFNDRLIVMRKVAPKRGEG